MNEQLEEVRHLTQLIYEHVYRRVILVEKYNGRLRKDEIAAVV